MKTLIRSLLLAAAALLAGSCKSGDGDAVPERTLNQTVYTKVGMHFDVRRGRYLMYSTNYLGMPKFVPPGTALTLERISGKGLTLRDGDGTEYRIEYVPKHSIMPITEWRARHFSDTPVPLPDGLTDDEREAIAVGEIRRGMSRDAVFLAVGYPPRSTNPAESEQKLVYEWRRFVRRTVRFDRDDKVDQIGL
ncbi:MAG: hypothetical protein KAI24_05075 [Planctomycetes bacterium]|nr:hypothetical protein [Planctomycetota bacterium]